MEKQLITIPKDVKFGDEIAPNLRYVGVNGKFTVLINTVTNQITYGLPPEEHQKDVDALEAYRNRSWWQKLLGL